MSKVALQLAQVNKVYAKVIHAVQNVNMEVEQGEIIALLGSSGCGKTSTLRMIAGFEEVTSGKIQLVGRSIHNLAPAKRNVAMAFEGYSLYPPLTVQENIAFALKSSQLSAEAQKQRIQRVVELLEIEDILARYPFSLSGGQQQRASLARALVRQADLYLLDEPMGQLEPRLRAVLRGRIKHYLKEQQMTTILVTHDQTEANALADRIAVMEKGILQQYATPQILKERPQNQFVGTFIGEPPMNVFPIRLSIANNALHIQLPDGQALSYPQQAFSPEVLNTLLQPEERVLGVRPYAVHLAESGLNAKVMSNQWLGDQTHLALRLGDTTLVAVAHSRVAAERGTPVHLQIHAQDLHFFAASTGQALVHGSRLA